MSNGYQNEQQNRPAVGRPNDVKSLGQKMPGSPSADSINSGMSVGSVVPVSVTPVDRKTIAGSTPGDFRKNAAPAVLPTQPGPREGMTQAPFRKGADNPPFVSTSNSPDSDAGN